MKKLLVVLFCLYFIQGNAQRKTDYENVVDKFMKFYNNNQPDSICDLYADSWGDARKTLWTAEKLKKIKDEFGTMKSYKYMDGKPGDLLLYKVVFEKSTHAMGLSLDKKSKLLTFRFKTTSDSIEKLLQQNDSNSNTNQIAIERYKTDSIIVQRDKHNIHTDYRSIEHDNSRIQHDSADLKRHSREMKDDMMKIHNDSIRMSESAK
jgi:hypothetical protein